MDLAQVERDRAARVPRAAGMLCLPVPVTCQGDSVASHVRRRAGRVRPVWPEDLRGEAPGRPPGGWQRHVLLKVPRLAGGREGRVAVDRDPHPELMPVPGRDADHQAFVSKQKAKGQLPALLAWAAKFDPATLTRHAITQPGDDPATGAEKILKFFGVASPAAFDQTWIQPRVSFRRAQSFAVAEQNTALWLRLVDRCAQIARVEPLSTGALRKVARAIPSMTTLSVTDGFTAARAALALSGVTLTFIREIPGTRLFGATWWLAADRPVIGLTERGRKPDAFWFNLLHEIGHILLHPRRATFLNLEDEKMTNEVPEQEASDFAEATLLPGNTRSRIAQARTRTELLLLAAELGIGISIVAGQHGHLTDKWYIGGTLRGKITDADVAALEAPCLSATPDPS